MTMDNRIVKAARLVKLILESGRVSVRRASVETGLPRRTVYRYVKNLSEVYDIRVDRGFIVIDIQPSNLP